MLLHPFHDVFMSDSGGRGGGKLTYWAFIKLLNCCHRQRFNIEIKCNFRKTKEVTHFERWCLGPVTFICTRLKIGEITSLFYANASITKSEHSDPGGHYTRNELELT